MKIFDCCLHCKHNVCTVTFDMASGWAVSHKNVCKITHKEKADTDTCKRFRHKVSILAA